MEEESLKKLKQKLEGTVGKRIDKFCQTVLASKHADNHCAHFVSHMLDYNITGTASCKTHTWDDKHNDKIIGASIRVNEIYNHINTLNKHPISDKACYKPGLVFVTQEKNMRIDGDMGSGKFKHIGILIGSWVYHYGNTADKVKKQDLTSFIRTFEQIYKGNGTVMFFRAEFIK